MLSHDELQRYARQMAMPEFGPAGQEKLRGARVLLIGAGGLGSPAALHLAAAGVGTLGIVDADEVELSEVIAVRERLTADNAIDLARSWDMVIDGSDNFPTRYASNDACVALGIPNVFGSVWRFEGQVAVFAPHLGGPCYRCVNPRAPERGAVPSCAEAGVLGVMPGLVGTMQALEAIKLLTGIGEPLVGRFLHIDGAALKFREFTLRRDPRCARCSEGRRDLPIEAEGDFCEACAVMSDGEISVTDLAALREAGDDHVLLDVREPWELATARLEPCLHIPMGELASRTGEIPRELPVYVMCHGGVRSGRVVEFLRGQGFGNVTNVRGGIAAWSAEVDGSVPPY
jgi:molybdopterin/thiamine biosynthesis adenylyltransferase/rhodanese-related sulfurtransferase